MQNRPYDLYALPKIGSLKDMLIQKKTDRPCGVAFAFSKGRDGIAEKTYQDVYEEVCALGTWMYRQGMKEKHIAVIGENSYEWLLCFFAAVIGGNVAVPIDKELPTEEIAELLHKADVQVVFASETYGNVVSGTDCMVYSMGDMEQFLAEGRQYIEAGDRTFLDYSIDSRKLCCIMFTSGTSGKSKGVMLSHRNIVEDINGSCQLVVLGGSTVSVLPFHHAFGLIVGVFMVYHYGFTIFLNKSLKTVQKDMQAVSPQVMFLVPLFVETFHRQIWAAAKKEGRDRMLKRLMKISDFLLSFGIDIRKKIFASVLRAFGGNLEYIICGGAPLGVQYIREFRSFGIEILNGYGTTECAPCAAVNRNHFYRDGTVGVAVPNISVKVSNDGEVLVKGPIVMQGYYQDREATDQVLKDGWYATGDLGTIDADGFITLTGRKKNLIILSNGENVSPEALEADFLQNPAVKEVLVYEQDRLIAAQIYPDMEYMKEKGLQEQLQEYFEGLQRKVNYNRPIYRQVGKIILRDTEFPKNTSKKILRYGINYAEREDKC